MEKLLRPSKLGIEPSAPGSDKHWVHWKKKFTNFLASITTQNPDKLALLVNFLEPTIYEFVSDCATYESAEAILEGLYNKPKNEIYARHLLASRRQKGEESIDQFLQTLKTLSKDCSFQAVSAQKNRDDCIEMLLLVDSLLMMSDKDY